MDPLLGPRPLLWRLSDVPDVQPSRESDFDGVEMWDGRPSLPSLNQAVCAKREAPSGASFSLWVRFGSGPLIQDPSEGGGELGSDVLRMLGLLELVGVYVERDRGSRVPGLT